MSSIVDSLLASIEGSGGLAGIGRTTGVGEADVSRVASVALPTLLEGLGRNASSQEGAGALLAALDRDHDGSVLDDLAGFLGGAGADPGVLRHTFGERQASVEQNLSRATGVDATSVSQILAMLAPLVMAYLGRRSRSQGLGAQDLSDILGRERQTMRERQPQATDFLTRMLDADGDGSVADELGELGSGLLGSLFGK